MLQPILGFSKKTKDEKIDWLVSTYLNNDNNSKNVLKQYWNNDEKTTKTTRWFYRKYGE